VRTLVSILIYICVVSAPVGVLIVFATILYGKFTRRPPSTLKDGRNSNDVIHLIGMLLTVFGIALGFLGSVLAFIFVTPSLSEYIQFVTDMFSM